METLTIYSIGDAAYLARILQGVAVLATSGTFAALGLIGALAGLVAIGFSAVREGKMNPGPLLAGVFLFLALFGYRVPVIITDYFAGPGRSVVQDDIPVGVAIVGSLVSHVGVGLADVTKTVYAYPGMERVPPTFALQNLLALRSSLYGSRQRSQVMEAAESSLVEYTKACAKPFLARNEDGATPQPYVSILHAPDSFTATRSSISTLSFQWKGPWSDTPGAPAGMPTRSQSPDIGTFFTCNEGGAMLETLMNAIMVPQMAQELKGQWQRENPEGFVNPTEVIALSMRALQYEAVNAQTIMRNVVMARALQIAESKHAIESQNVATAILVEGGLQQRNIQQASETAFFVSNLRQLMTLFEGVVYAMAPFAALFLATGTGFALKAIGTYVMTLVWVMTWLPIMAVVNLFALLAVQFEMNALIPPSAAAASAAGVIDQPPITSIFGMLEIQHSAEQWIAFSGLAGSMVIAIAGMMVFRGVAAFGALAQRATGGDFVNESAVAPNPLETGPLMRQSSFATGTAAGGLEAPGFAQMRYSETATSEASVSSAQSQVASTTQAASESLAQALSRAHRVSEAGTTRQTGSTSTGTDATTTVAGTSTLSGAASSAQDLSQSAGSSERSTSSEVESKGMGSIGKADVSGLQRTARGATPNKGGTFDAIRQVGALAKGANLVGLLSGAVNAGNNFRLEAADVLTAARDAAQRIGTSSAAGWEQREDMSASERAATETAIIAEFARAAGFELQQSDLSQLQRNLEARNTAEERFQEASALASRIGAGREWSESDLAAQITSRTPHLAAELLRSAERLGGNPALQEDIQNAARAMGVGINDPAAQVAGAMRTLNDVGMLSADRNSPAAAEARDWMLRAMRFDDQATGDRAGRDPFANQAIPVPNVDAAGLMQRTGGLPGPQVGAGDVPAMAQGATAAAQSQLDELRAGVASGIDGQRQGIEAFVGNAQAQTEAFRQDRIAERFAGAAETLARMTSGPSHENAVPPGTTTFNTPMGQVVLGTAPDGSIAADLREPTVWVNENREFVENAMARAMASADPAFAQTPEARTLAFLTGVHATQPESGERPMTDAEREQFAALRADMTSRFGGDERKADLAIAGLSEVARSAANNDQLARGIIAGTVEDIASSVDIGTNADQMVRPVIDSAQQTVGYVGETTPSAQPQVGTIAPPAPEFGVGDLRTVGGQLLALSPFSAVDDVANLAVQTGILPSPGTSSPSDGQAAHETPFGGVLSEFRNSLTGLMDPTLTTVDPGPGRASLGDYPPARGEAPASGSALEQPSGFTSQAADQGFAAATAEASPDGGQGTSAPPTAPAPTQPASEPKEAKPAPGRNP